MLTEMQLRPSEEGQTVISLSVPSARVQEVVNTIRGVLNLVDHKVKNINENGEELRTIEEVFPDASPAMTLRGYWARWNGPSRSLPTNWAPPRTEFRIWKAVKDA